jgi:hypothetical protein
MSLPPDGPHLLVTRGGMEVPIAPALRAPRAVTEDRQAVHPTSLQRLGLRMEP